MTACKWLERDATGRPRCEHGWAHKAGRHWRCRSKSLANSLRYYRTDVGREKERLRNARDDVRVRKQLYELTRIPVS